MSVGRLASLLLLLVLLAGLVGMMFLAYNWDYPARVTVALAGAGVLHLPAVGQVLDEPGRGPSGVRILGPAYLLYIVWVLVAIPMAIIMVTGENDPNWRQMMFGLPLAVLVVIQLTTRRLRSQRSDL